MLVSAGVTVPCFYTIMLSYLDPTLFPDQYKIYELTPDQFVYPIYKNASSTIAKIALAEVPYYKHNQIKTIQLYLRDPFDRYVSGVQTYLNHNPEFDRETALKFIERFLFLNSHFSLQFHWILNLARHSDAWMQFKHIDELKDTTDQVWNTLSRDQSLIDRFQHNHKLNYYLMLDKVLYEDFIGETVSFRQVCTHVQHKYPALYKEVIQRSKNLCNALG